MKLRSFVAFSLVLGAFACASVKPPRIQVQNLGVEKAGLTGVALRVGFALQNPNDKDLAIERFEYELFLNGHSLGHGYGAEPVLVRALGEERVTSRFNVDLFKLPGTVKALLDQDRAKARAKGKFHVREGDGIKKVGFDSEASVDLNR
jgi:LEA14-like dessication related protein